MVTVQSESNVTDSVVLVWSVDGTLEYFGYHHILLFVVALVSLLFLWLPYTLLLLLIQWLQRISHFRVLRWTMRFNSFYDAYFAPLKPGHQYWFGVLLLARGMILITFASNFALPQDISLLILLVTAGLLLFYMFLENVYKSRKATVFHSSFLLNLCLLSGSMIFAHTGRRIKHTIQAVAVGLSIGTAFLQFCYVFFYQIYIMCCSLKGGKYQETVGINEEQVDAILDLSGQRKDPRHSAERQPLIRLTVMYQLPNCM